MVIAADIFSINVVRCVSLVDSPSLTTIMSEPLYYPSGDLSQPIAQEGTIRQKCQAYYELTRLHKFPLGNILVIWPSRMCLSLWGSEISESC